MTHDQIRDGSISRYNRITTANRTDNHSSFGLRYSFFIRHSCCLIFLLLLYVGCAKAAEPTKTMVPMSDGIKLATDVFVPEKGGPKFSTILVRTPYNKDALKQAAANLTKLGYAFIVQDMRGRFASEGHHSIIFGNDGIGGVHQDGHDTLRWIAAQEWSNGRVVTWGGSALGIVQNMAAPNAPEALKGQVVMVAFSNYYEQAAYQGGVWRKELIEDWLKKQNMADVNLSTFLAHSTYDEFWHKLNAEQHAAEVNAPGVFIGGWYDIFLQGTINSFDTIQKQGGPHARGKCFLVIGPTAHGPFAEKINYPRSAQSPINTFVPMNLIMQWLSDEPDKTAEPLKPVHYYVMGDTVAKDAPGNVWRSADAWPPPATNTSYYFSSDKKLGTEKQNDETKLTYQYDPTKPVPTTGGQNLHLPKGPMDQRPVESRPDVLLFTSEPLKEPLEVTGRITAKLYVSSDCPDTDFTVKLCDVYPDGRSMLVTDGIRRASLRNSYEKREPLRPGEVVELEIDLWSTSLIFNTGHQIRVAVSSSNAPRFEPNPNTGDPHPVAGKTRVANNTLHLSEKHPSCIVLPVYKEN